MAISDLFSTSFLFSIALIIILIGGIFAYVSYRMSEQDHKLTSMVNLVSILAQDLQFVKSKLVTFENTNNNNHNLQYSSDIMGGQNSSDLISVSDEEDDEDDDYSEESDDNDNITIDDSSCCSDDDDDCGEVFDESQEQIKLLNLTLANEDIYNDSPIEELVCDFKPTDSELYSNEDIKTIHIEAPLTFEETEIKMSLESEHNDTQEDINFVTNNGFNLKNTSIIDLGEAEDVHASKSEYKKMSLNKLREVVVNKGVVADASKLKKNEILKLLGDD